jgi:hypothetical protein
MVKGEMAMSQGDGEKKEDRKSRKTREDTVRVFSQETTYSETGLFGMRIEDCRESRNEEARLAQILTVSKNREEGTKGRRSWRGVDRAKRRHKMRSNEAARPSVALNRVSQPPRFGSEEAAVGRNERTALMTLISRCG